MAILAECPGCHKKLSNKRKICTCGEDMDRAKRTGNRVRYWISYHYFDEKNKRRQKRESVGAFEDLDPYSIKDAREAESQRVVQKREKKIFDVLAESTITFNELSDWYKDLKQIKKLSSFRRIKSILKNFNREFGYRQTNSLKATPC